jgi:hypothetical protein
MVPSSWPEPRLLGDGPRLRANDRPVRHCVQDRVGREALFGLRQIVEFRATRNLLKHGWPLAEAAEIVRAPDVTGLTDPSDRPRLDPFGGRTKPHITSGARVRPII